MGPMSAPKVPVREVPRDKRDAAPFELPVCRNCGAALADRYCAACGQKQVGRLGVQDVTDLAWQNLRRFEFSLFKAMARVAVAPGRVAREFVLGARSRHIHPFKLLLTCIVFLLIFLNRTDYLTASTKELTHAVELLQSYAKWSFSLGVFAIFGTSMLAFWAWRPFNWVEHLVLAAYAHSTVLMANMANLSPLLLKQDTATVLAHRAASKGYMTWIEAGVVFLALGQFFAVDWRRQWWWPLIGTAVFVLLKKAIIWAYARLIIRVVMLQLS